MAPFLHLKIKSLSFVRSNFTYKFQNLIIILLQVMEEKNEVYNKTLNEIDRLITLIDIELKNKLSSQ